MLTPAEADQLIGARLPRLPVESLPLQQCAGAVLHEEIHAERDQPPFDRVAMDGIAIDSRAARAGSTRFRVQAIQAAGDAPLTLAAGDCCIEIMTGAMLAHGCDAVVPIERVALHDGLAELEVGCTVTAWQNVHRAGSDCHRGALLLGAGTPLRAPEIAIAAANGAGRLRVSAQPAIVVVSTGSELVDPGEPILPHQVRRSNAYGLVAQLRLHGYDRVADDHVPDDPALLGERLKAHLDTHDVLILSGGVSAGRLDLVPGTLAALGVQRHFHKIAQRPGKPLWFGTTPRGTIVFGLPGNPVSSFVCLSRYVLPALRLAMGGPAAGPERLVLAAPVRTKPTLACFVPVCVGQDATGRRHATPRETNGSGDFTSLTGTDGFVELPPGSGTCEPGFVAPFYAW